MPSPLGRSSLIAADAQLVTTVQTAVMSAGGEGGPFEGPIGEQTRDDAFAAQFPSGTRVAT